MGQRPQSSGRPRQRERDFESSAILPLPREVQQVAQNGNRCENISLWLDRFLTVDQKTWELTQDAKRRAQVKQLANASRLQGFVSALQRRCEAILRWHEQRGLIVKSFKAKLVWRFVVGLGAAHVLETSITLHRLFGLPIIPGSALKGAARAYATLAEKKEDNDPELIAVFGTTEKAGSVIFLDAIPAEVPQFQLDIMNPHYPNYYRTRGQHPPADWESPNPVFFLTVHMASYQFALAARHESGNRLLDTAEKWLRGALSELGIGAKTSAGYGYWTIEK